tara:strand:- start:108 stop:377 length:270 start_codon:yes stop_codon:yes gene_type:complete
MRNCCIGFWVLAFYSVQASDDPADAPMRTRVVPLVFSTDNTEVAYGLGAVSIGAGQPQAALFGVGFKSENKSQAVSIGAINYQVPGLSQ